MAEAAPKRYDVKDLDLERVTTGQKIEIDQLIKNCNDIRQKVDGSLEELDILSELLVKNATKAEEDIDEAFRNAVKMLENNRNKLKDEVKMVVSEKNKKISADKHTIQLQQTRLVTALQMATEVLQTGSDYFSLKTNLSTLCDLKPTQVSTYLGDVSFRPTATSQHVPCSLGSVSYGSSRHVKKEVSVWKMEKSFGDLGNAQVIEERDIAITQQNIVFVTDFRGKLVKCYETNGNLKSSTGIRDPWCIKVSQDGRVFVTNLTKHVSIYDTEMTMQKQFAVKSPDGISSDSQDTRLSCLAIDNHNMLLVGECNQKYISKHRLDGTHVISFKVTIPPLCISVSPQCKIVVSSGNEAVHILDEHGNHLHNVQPRVQLPPRISSWDPKPRSSWDPRGVCCSSDDEVYIANCTWFGSIDIYSTESGGYIGCLTKDVSYPIRLALNDDEDKLFVLEMGCVKIFQRE